jgi:hypothetical protein
VEEGGCEGGSVWGGRVGEEGRVEVVGRRNDGPKGFFGMRSVLRGGVWEGEGGEVEMGLWGCVGVERRGADDGSCSSSPMAGIEALPMRVWGSRWIGLLDGCARAPLTPLQHRKTPRPFFLSSLRWFDCVCCGCCRSGARWQS